MAGGVRSCLFCIGAEAEGKLGVESDGCHGGTVLAGMLPGVCAPASGITGMCHDWAGVVVRALEQGKADAGAVGFVGLWKVLESSMDMPAAITSGFSLA